MSNLSQTSKRKILIKSNCRCFYCGEDLTVNKFEFDHINPFSISKDGRMTNIVAACVPCNRTKSDLTLEQFRNVLQLRLAVDIVFFFEKYGIVIEKEGATYKHTLNSKTFNQ